MNMTHFMMIVMMFIKMTLHKHYNYEATVKPV